MLQLLYNLLEKLASILYWLDTPRIPCVTGQKQVYYNESIGNT